jgi:hypothetical protein
MSHSGEELGADLVDLYDAGRYKMKAVAEQFRLAGGELFRTGGQTGAFARNPALGGGYGPALEPWEQLRDAVVDIIFRTASNMDDTGLAPMMAADEYAKTDQAAARKYEELNAALDRSNGAPS